MQTISPLLVPTNLAFVRIRIVSVLTGFQHVDVYAIWIPLLPDRRDILFSSAAMWHITSGGDLL